METKNGTKRIVTLAAIVGLGLTGLGKLGCEGDEVIKEAKKYQRAYSTQEVSRNDEMKRYDYNNDGRLDPAEARDYNSGNK